MDILIIILPLIIVAVLVIVIIASLVNRPVVTSGTVIDKYHEEATSWYSLFPIFVNKSVIMIPMYHFDDEDWVLVLEARDDEGKTITGELYVSKKTYQETPIGSYYSLGPADSTYDEDVEEEVDEIPDGANVKE